MLAILLRLSYALQASVGGLIGGFWGLADQVMICTLLGAVLLPMLLQALLTITSVALSAPYRQVTSAYRPGGVWRFVLLWIAEWKAAFTVFALRQPWGRRSPGIVLPPTRHDADFVRLPVLLVHGFICNHRVWDEVIAALRQRGHPALAIDLEPLFTSIDDYASQIEAAVQSLRSSSGHDKVALIGHSMGGLVIRAWMRAYGTQHVGGVITLGSPHHGSLLAAWSTTPNGRQMRWQSDWLTTLAAQETPETRSLIHVALSDADNIVYPQRQQTLEGSTLTEFAGLGHLELCLRSEVISWLCGQLRALSAASSQTMTRSQSFQVDCSVADGSTLSPRRPADLFWAFSWIALQGFGGVLAVLQRELVDRKKWMTQNQFVDDWSVSQILPGPNVVNLALMMGDRYFGWRGSVAALSGIVIFPMFLVLGVAVFFSGVSDQPEVRGALRGMGAVAAGMIAGQSLRLMSSLRANVLGIYLSYGVALATFVASALLGVPLVWILVLVGASACVAAYILLGHQPHDRQS